MIPYRCMAKFGAVLNGQGPSDLTPRQAELLSYIEEVAGEDHRMPSYREMAAALKLSAVGSIQKKNILLSKGVILFFLLRDNLRFCRFHW
jgi:SOS-response transcriptional repressor LexA